MRRATAFGLVISVVLIGVFGCADQSHGTTDGRAKIAQNPGDPAPPLRDAAHCTKPEVDIGPPAPESVLGSARVQLFLTAPELYGRDAPALDRELAAITEHTLASDELDWDHCRTNSSLGLECPAWDVETKCASTQSGMVLSLVCINRLSEAEYADVLRPSISYRSINALRCGESLRILNFEQDLCPSWRCLSDLHESLVRLGIREGSLGSESSRVKEALEHFYLADGHIVFLLGDSSIDSLDYDDRFVFGYNVVALSYADFSLVAPDAVPVLQEAGLMPTTGR